MTQAEKVSPEELVVLQAIHTKFQVAQAELQGALNLLAATYKLPNDSRIDPQTGVITRPDPTTEAS